MVAKGESIPLSGWDGSWQVALSVRSPEKAPRTLIEMEPSFFGKTRIFLM